MRLAVVVQARMGSSRLPGKVMRLVSGAPLLQRQIERVAAARTPFTLVVATTVDGEDDAIVSLCRSLDVSCVRGHRTDLLVRHLQAARAVGAEAVAKIPSDCPLIDPAVIDRVLGAFLQDPERWDYVSNLHPPSWPDGNDVEVMPMAALEAACREARVPFEREHTTPFFWERPERFRLHNVRSASPRDLSRSHRFTVDYEEDLDFVRAVYAALFQTGAAPFSLEAILRLLEGAPHLLSLNDRHAGVNWYRHHLGALRTVTAADTRLSEEAR